MYCNTCSEKSEINNDASVFSGCNWKRTPRNNTTVEIHRQTRRVRAFKYFLSLLIRNKFWRPLLTYQLVKSVRNGRYICEYVWVWEEGSGTCCWNGLDTML